MTATQIAAKDAVAEAAKAAEPGTPQVTDKP